jgi:hypothetical protein
MAQDTITFSGVNAHWKNGVAECHIHDLQEAATTMLLYPQCNWPDAIDKAFWSYAMRRANNMCKNVPLQNKKNSPLDHFFQLKLPYNFAPAYVYNDEIQQGYKAKKWEEKEGLAFIWVNQHNTPTQSCSFSHCNLVTYLCNFIASSTLILKAERQAKACLKPTSAWKKERLTPLLSPVPVATPAILLVQPSIHEAVESKTSEPPSLPSVDLRVTVDDQVLLPEQHKLQPQQKVRQSGRQWQPPVCFQDYRTIDQIAIPTTAELSLEESFNPAYSSNPLLA